MNLDFTFCFCVCAFICSAVCNDWKCPERGKIGGLKVPNVLSLIDGQTGYRASVEAIYPKKKTTIIDDYYDSRNQTGIIDTQIIFYRSAKRFYYYNEKKLRFTIEKGNCDEKELNQKVKISTIQDWFEPYEIVSQSDIFKDPVHLGPTLLMIYANKISDKVSFVGSELIDGRSVNHWFYCLDPKGPYIDIYFDAITSFPYRFLLYYPELKDDKQVDSSEKYIYNFYMFEPLVLSSSDPIPYPLGHSCSGNSAKQKPLPKFGQADKFTMDLQAVITFPNDQVVVSIARVVKLGEITSYEFKEGLDLSRSIELPVPLGNFIVNPNTGSCSVKMSDYGRSVTLVTRWPFKEDLGFNLLESLVMKPHPDRYGGDSVSFLSDENLGPYRVQTYEALSYFSSPDSMYKSSAVVEYLYKNSSSVPYKVIISKYRLASFTPGPDRIEVNILNYGTDNLDYEDRFDVSGCYQESGSFTWFQLLFSNPFEIEYDAESMKEQMKEYLNSFIPIFRVGPIHVQQVASNIYVTVKLYDRLPFINAYQKEAARKLSSPINIIKRFSREECEKVCTSSNVKGSFCYSFSFCDNFDCIIGGKQFGVAPSMYNNVNCTTYYRENPAYDISPFVVKNYLSPISNVLQQIRDKVSSGDFILNGFNLPAEEMFIVNGPEEIGDSYHGLIMKFDSPTALKAEDFPLIIKDHHINEAQIVIEKSTLNNCFMACLNDDNCNTLSYCIDGIKECILSNETSSSLKDTIGDKTSHADKCNIYEKSFMNLFHKYPGKNLVLDAISTLSDIKVTDCASACIQSNEFDCESFDYCEETDSRNESLCFLHVNHIVIDSDHELNASNYKLTDSGCSHYSKKSELDYAHKLGFGLVDIDQKSIIANYEHLSLDFCASKCNLDLNCHIFEYCQNTDFSGISDDNYASTSCSLTNLKSNDFTLSQSIEPLKSDTKICSIYIKHMKVTRKNETSTQSYDEPETSDSESTEAESSRIISSPTKSNNLSLAMVLSTVVFIIAFAVGFIGSKFAFRQGILKTNEKI